MKKIMDFCGSGELLKEMLDAVYFCDALFKEISGRKVTMMIFAEDEQDYPWTKVSYEAGEGWKYETIAHGNIAGAEINNKEMLQGNDLSMNVEDDLRFGESMESLDGRHEPEYQPKFGPDKNGWIEWRGGECPVPVGSLVRVKLRGGFAVSPAGLFQPNYFRWDHKNTEIDIIAYKLADQFSAERGDDEESQV